MGFPLPGKNGSNQDTEGRRLNRAVGARGERLSWGRWQAQGSSQRGSAPENSSSHPPFPFLSQNMRKESSTICPYQDPSRISVAWLSYQPWSMGAGRPYFQMLTAMFLTISRLFPFPSTLSVEELHSWVRTMLGVQVHSYLSR